MALPKQTFYIVSGIPPSISRVLEAYCSHFCGTVLPDSDQVYLPCSALRPRSKRSSTLSGASPGDLIRACFSQLSRHVVLINGDRLAALMIRYDVGVRVEEALYLKKIDEDFFPG